VRILLAPLEIAGYMGRLRDGFSGLGHEAKFLDLTDTYLKYNAVDDFPSAGPFKKLKRNIASMPAPLRLLLGIPVKFAFKSYFFLFSLIWPEVVVFCFAHTILGGWELPFYRFLGKKVVMVYLGSDSRPPYMNGSVVTETRGISIEECRRLTRKAKLRIRWLDKFANVIVDHAPCAYFHERPFVPFLRIGMPTLTAANPVPVCGAGGRIRIVHAPTFPEAKGTFIVRKVIEKLIAEGAEIDYVELSGRPNAEVLEEVSKCSFVVDELYSDNVLAGLGTEAATLGKATIIGGYVHDVDLGVPHEMIPPAIRTMPEEFERTLRETILSRNFREVGAAAHRFVTEHWNPAEVAKRLLALIEPGSGGIGAVDPAGTAYVHGWGFPAEKLRIFLRKYLHMFGAAALYLEDKPALRQAILDFAAGKDDV
jgi:hypothetical protein